MGSKKGHRRNEDSEETGTVKESEHGELVVLNGGSVDLNGRVGRKREKKRKVDSGDVLDDVDGKDHDDDCDHRKAEEEERKKEAKENNGKKKRKIDLDEQRGERGDADIGSNKSDINHGKVEEEGKRKKEKKDKKKKIQKVEEPREEKGRADFVGVELDDRKVEKDIKKEKRKKKRIVEKYWYERGNDDFASNGTQRSDEMVQAEEYKEEKRKESKKKRKKNKTQGDRQSEEKQSEKETDRARKKGLGKNVHVLRGGTCTTEVKRDSKGGGKGKEKVVGGNFDCLEDIQSIREPAEILENLRRKKGKRGREKNGRSNVESEDQGDE